MIKGGAAWKQLPEWVAYHRLLGVEHFYIYVNEHIPNLLDPKSSTIKDFLANTPLSQHVTFIPFQDDLGRFQMQTVQLADCLHRGRGQSEWVMMNDVDEYFQVMTNASSTTTMNSLSHFLKTILEDGSVPNKLGAIQAKNLYFYRKYSINVIKEISNKTVSLEQRKCPKLWKREKKQPLVTSSNNTTVELYPYSSNEATDRGREKSVHRPWYAIFPSPHRLESGERLLMDPATQLRSSHFKYALNGKCIVHELISDSSLAHRFGPQIRNILYPN
mmetsp:Transcript_10501/g.29011  ORF Transcript_10501/g.29011 Transcript_10501/m.29011 type:complete len:274 (-) Transcript_10501:168-989(-)